MAGETKTQVCGYFLIEVYIISDDNDDDDNYTHTHTNMALKT